MLRRVRALAERDGLAMLMTTHHPDHAFLVADDAAVLHHGSLQGPAPPEALVTPALLREAYGVEAAVGAIETAAGPRRVCVPLVFGAAP